MNPAQRARRLQAHNLRCQGLTYRHIAEQIGCAASTAAQYVRQFEAQRAEIVESLTADILVHSVAGLQGDDPDLHARHIANARELRLLLNSLDQVEDRRQRRERRVHENNVRDAEKEINDLEEIARIMIETGHWDVTEDVDHLFEPVFGPNAQNRRPREGGGPPASTPAQTHVRPAQTHAKPAQQPSKSAQNRTQSNKTEQKSANRPPVQPPPRPKRKKSRPKPGKTSQDPPQPQPQIPIPVPAPSVDDIPDPPFILKNLRPIDSRGRRLPEFFPPR